MDQILEKTKSAKEPCSSCPTNQFGICPGMLKIFTQQNEFYSHKHFSLAANQYLFHQGEQSHDFYILQKGWILLTQVTEQGKKQVIRSVLSGDILGFQPELDGPSLYSAIAVLDSVVCRFHDFMKMCSLNPELALRLVWTVARESTLTELYMTNIAHRNAREKIAFMVLELYQRLKLRGLNNENTIPFPLKQEDIADQLGLTAIHVNRTLHKLHQENLITLHKHRLTILDYEKLDKLVNLELKPLKSCDLLRDVY